MHGRVEYKDAHRNAGLAGYVVFDDDAAQLAELERSYSRHLAVPADVPGGGLIHANRPPLTEDDRIALANLENGRVEAGAEASSPKKAAAVPLRRSGGSIALDYSPLDGSSARMLAAMDRFSAHMALSGDLAAFAPFGATELISSALPAERFKELGVEADPARWSRLRAGLLLPLRDWKNHPIVKGLPTDERGTIQADIDRATREYIKSMNVLLAASPLDSPKILAAAARWGYNVQLSHYFEVFRTRTLAATGSRGPPMVSRLPFVKSVQKDVLLLDGVSAEKKTFPDGRQYLSYRVGWENRPDASSYERFLDSTVEPIYNGGGPFGHINLRVGRRIYSFNYTLNTSRNDFSLNRMPINRTGFVFRVDPEKIRAVHDELEKIYRNSENNNVPPFEAVHRSQENDPHPFDESSPKLEILSSEIGWIQLRSATPTGRNNGAIRAHLVENGTNAYLRTNDGFEYPVLIEGGKKYVQSLSCASSATYVLKKYFNIDIAFNPGAKSLNRALEDGNAGRQAPDAIINY